MNSIMFMLIYFTLLTIYTYGIINYHLSKNLAIVQLNLHLHIFLLEAVRQPLLGVD